MPRIALWMWLWGMELTPISFKRNLEKYKKRHTCASPYCLNLKGQKHLKLKRDLWTPNFPWQEAKRKLCNCKHILIIFWIRTISQRLQTKNIGEGEIRGEQNWEHSRNIPRGQRSGLWPHVLAALKTFYRLIQLWASLPPQFEWGCLL